MMDGLDVSERDPVLKSMQSLEVLQACLHVHTICYLEHLSCPQGQQLLDMAGVLV
jgi:hypothetical protein